MKTSLPPFVLPFLILIATLSGSGCRATRHVLDLSRPRLEPVPHRVQSIEGAYLTASGGILLHATGTLAGSNHPTSLTITLGRVRPSPDSMAERFAVPASAVQSGWAPGEALRPVKVGPPIDFKSGETYEWHRLAPSPDAVESVHLVRRQGHGGNWEVLRVNPSQTTRFMIYEVRPTYVTVSQPAYALLVPFAAAADTVAVGTMVVGPPVTVATIGALPSAGIYLAAEAAKEMPNHYRKLMSD